MIFPVVIDGPVANLQSAEWALAPFDSIRIEAPVSLTIRPGSRSRVHVGGLSAMASMSVEDGVLIIRSLGGPVGDLLVVVPDLKSLQVDAAADVTLHHVRAEDLQITVNGALQLQGRGVAQSLSILLNGAGSLDLRRFAVPSVNLNVNGAAEADVFASESLNVTINGAGQVLYHSWPEAIERKINGVGEINPANG